MAGNPTQQPSRVLLANDARLLREMLKCAIEKSPHIRVVGEVEVSDGKKLTTMVEERDADWVVLSLFPDGEIPGMAETLLMENPSVAVLAVAPDGSQLRVGWTELREETIAVAPSGNLVELKWTEPHEKLLEDLSLDELTKILNKGSLWKLIVRASKDEAL